jgi:D-sedoheptulose 7-phosphate isomerase
MHERNAVSRAFFAREAARLAPLCARMAERFEQGGRLLAFGTGSSVTDAQHVAVEFTHPVLVGKRALPALDLSLAFTEVLPSTLRRRDIVIGFGPPEGDSRVETAVREAVSRGALALALPGTAGDYSIVPASPDPFIHQEIVEILYHTIWETVHVFLDRQTVGREAGAAAFLYPFLSSEPQPIDVMVEEVAASIRSKARQVERLRDEIAAEQGSGIAAAAWAIHERVSQGGTVLCFGNGGSATDATDFALDLAASSKPQRPVPALSLASEPATLTAIANDIGSEAMFLRQIMAHGTAGDVAVAFSTSGGSANIIAALQAARARGLLTVALLGYDGGEILRRRLADQALVVKSDQIPRVQEAQASIYHVIVNVLDAMRGGA